MICLASLNTYASIGDALKSFVPYKTSILVVGVKMH